ncbi:uncharacterized protein LOC142347940 [Convolutriloba macropyga]|uniref:uncharacterized protein LOC142347940 n=1 Tax=Convolutriloba macropyga TaxID=536237 RepID=UPI003F5211BE
MHPILIHLALDRFLTVRFAHIPDKTHDKFKNISFIIIAIFTSYCIWITIIHSAYNQYGFTESGETLKELYDIFWYQLPSMYIMTFLYSLVVITTSILYSLVAYLLYKQTKTSGGNKIDKKMKRNREITLLFLLSTLAYIVFWFPEVSYAFFWQWRNIDCLFTYYFRFKYSTRFGFFMDWARELLFYIYSVVNPLLFIGTQKNFHPRRFHRDFMKKYRKLRGKYLGREDTDSKIVHTGNPTAATTRF